MLADLRYAFRLLHQRSGLSATVILTMAVAIGTGAAVFSIVNGVLLQPLPYPHADRLVTLWEVQKDSASRQGVSPPNFVDWATETTSLEGISIFSGASFSLKDDEGHPRLIRGMFVSPEFFSLLGIDAAVGRVFRAEDSAAVDAAVLSHDFWQEYYAGKSDIVGQRLRSEQGNRTIIGVLPKGFYFPEPADIWVSRLVAGEETAEKMRGARYLRVLGKLKSGVEVEEARISLSRIEDNAAGNRGWGVQVIPLHDLVVADYRTSLSILFAAVLFLLLIAGSNTTSLLLSRSAERRREMALRTALGAGRFRLIRQLMIESTTLFFLAGVAGLLLASWLIEPLLKLAPAQLPRIENVRVDLTVLAFGLGLALLASLAFGCIPAWQATRLKLQTVLKSAAATHTGSAGNRMGRFLMTSQVSLSLILLVGSGLMIQSFSRLQNVDPGFNPANAWTFFLALPDTRYPTEAQRAGFFAELGERIQRLPQVEAAGASTNLPLSGSAMTFGFNIPGQQTGDASEERSAQYHAATPGYFEAMGLRLLKGRSFAAEDRSEGRQVAIVNEIMSRTYWPGQEALGRQIITFSRKGATQREVVGIVHNVKHSALEAEDVAEIYVPHAQDAWSFMSVVIRSQAPPEILWASVRDQVWEIDPALPVDRQDPLDRLIESSQASVRFQMLILSFFAAVSLLLAAVGLYAVIAFHVALMTREIGIRQALGATRSAIFRMVLLQGGSLIVAGLVVGLAGTLALSRFLTSQLFQVAPRDPLTLAAAAIVLGGAGLAACWLPAVKATRIDPLKAIRYE